MNNKTDKRLKRNSFDITKFSLLRDLILVKAIRPESNSGLVNPEQYEDKPEFGEVIRLGEKVSDKRIKIGTIVRFGKYSTETIRSNGNDYFIVHEEDCGAILE